MCKSAKVLEEYKYEDDYKVTSQGSLSIRLLRAAFST
jgi:hypothetical protein